MQGLASIYGSVIQNVPEKLQFQPANILNLGLINFVGSHHFLRAIGQKPVYFDPFLTILDNILVPNSKLCKVHASRFLIVGLKPRGVISRA